MSSKKHLSNLAAGFVLGAAVGAFIGLLYAPESGEESRELAKERLHFIAAPLKRLLFELKWLAMSPRDKYRYHWSHGGSLHDWRSS